MSDEQPGDAGVTEEAAPDTDEVTGLREELARMEDRYRRALADLDNYRKRMERDGARRVDEARRRLLTEWLEVYDSVERAQRLEPDDPGLVAVRGQMEQILARNGVARIEAEGTPFDPSRYDAIAVQPAYDVPDRTVLEVTRSGFMLTDGEVLRPAQVVVSKATDPAEGS